MTTDGDRRDSRALEPELITDPYLKAEAEARNGLLQFDAAVAMAQTAIEHSVFKLRVSSILTLHREALKGISVYAGMPRPGAVEISESKHIPPGPHLVVGLLEEMCDYVNENWDNSSAIHLAAYVMWRLNWIHPFADGNGRTSRILSYLVLCVRTGLVLLGTPSIPDQIVNDRRGYFAALDAADAALKENASVDVSQMEELLSSMLAVQLKSVYESAGGKMPT